jgi:hypothetical protein
VIYGLLARVLGSHAWLAFGEGRPARGVARSDTVQTRADRVRKGAAAERLGLK